MYVDQQFLKNMLIITIKLLWSKYLKKTGIHQWRKKLLHPGLCIKQVKSEKKDYNQDALDIHPILSLSSVLLMSFYDENVTVRTPVSNCFFDKFCARIVHTLCLGMDPKLGRTQSLIFGYSSWNVRYGYKCFGYPVFGSGNGLIFGPIITLCVQV